MAHPTELRLTYWQTLPLSAERYDVADEPMEGEMDSTFFLTKEKNWIPHTYPCRTAYIAERRDQEPETKPLPDWSGARNVMPMGSPFLDLSNFWFRATRLEGWARTSVKAEEAGRARFRLGICGAAKAYVNGQPAGWLAPATRNAMNHAEFEADLTEGDNEIAIWFEDLAERDAVIRIDLALISGPLCSEGYPFPAPAETVAAVERAMEAMHLDRAVYDGGEVALICPKPFPGDADGAVKVAGHFMSHGGLSNTLTIPKGAERVAVCNAEDLPADYRYFDIALNCQGFETSIRLGAEITHRTRLGEAPADQFARGEEALQWIAANAEPDTERALACAAVGTSLADAAKIIEGELPAIEECFDCADFSLVPLLWARIVYGDRLPAPLVERIDRATLTYRYWMDEPGNDVQWYFSENHALLFHTACHLAGNLMPDKTFIRSGRKGSEQSEVGRQRLMDWFDHFEASEMAEFNSVPYFPIDLKGLTALYALSPDETIRDRARRAILRLIEVVANSAHHGFLTAAQGRSYQHSLAVADTLELTALSRLLWRRGSLGAHVHCLAQLALCLLDHALEVPDFSDRACLEEGTAREWTFWQGKDGFARLYHYKTAETALGSAAKYRWYEWGYQETLIHGRIGREAHAQFWINHPGEMTQAGFGRPSYWGGSASIPRVQQYRSLAIVVFSGQEGQIPFTHAWFPTPIFDAWDVEGTTAWAQSGAGMLRLFGNAPFELVREGASAGHELRLPGVNGVWIVRLDDRKTLQGAPFASPLEARRTDQSYVVEDPAYGTVRFNDDGTVEAGGRTIDPASWTLSGEASPIKTADPGLPR